jgi:hypothetical protein
MKALFATCTFGIGSIYNKEMPGLKDYKENCKVSQFFIRSLFKYQTCQMQVIED